MRFTRNARTVSLIISPALCQKRCEPLQIECTHGFSNKDHKLIYQRSTCPTLSSPTICRSEIVFTSLQRIQVRQFSSGNGCPNLNRSQASSVFTSELPVLGHGMHGRAVLAEAQSTIGTPHFTRRLARFTALSNLSLSSHLA